MPTTFGRVVHPPFRDRLIPDSATRAWDDLGQRKPIGVVFHTMVGTLWGTDGYFRSGAPALTDYGIGGSTDGQYDGVILRWNDPRGRRSGWANGGSDGLEGDGPLFVRTLGVNAINRDLVSIERSDGGDVGTPMSPKQVESLCQLSAYWFDQARVPWDRFPVNPNVGGGIVTNFFHREFATKGCPWAAVEDRIDELQTRIRAILKVAQTDDAGDPVVPIPEPKPDHAWWPQGYAVDELRERFGGLERHLEGGTTRRMGFDPSGVISNAWVARGVAERRTVRQLPAARDWWSHPSGTGGQVDVVTFASGWILLRPDRNVAWRWVV
jgi:hypothetical protein